MNRKEFLSLSAPAFLLLANGNIIKAQDLVSSAIYRKKSRLRFVVASDGHYGQPNTDYENFYATLVERINEEHRKDPFAFCVINGDIIHDDKKYFPAAKAALDKLALKYYVSQGNHDHVNAEEWEKIWNMPVNLDFSIRKNSFLVATTSNEKGTYLCPELDWLREKLAEHRRQENVFIFMHINPGKLTRHAVDCPELFEMLASHKNVRAIFNGHDHDEEGIKARESIPFVFDAHFGGSWGTEYRGFRVVELMKDNSVLTYIMDPRDKINEARLERSRQPALA